MKGGVIVSFVISFVYIIYQLPEGKPGVCRGHTCIRPNDSVHIEYCLTVVMHYRIGERMSRVLGFYDFVPHQMP